MDNLVRFDGFKLCVDDNYGTSVCNSADRLSAIFTYKHEVANRADTQTTIILSQIIAQDTVYLYL